MTDWQPIGSAPRDGTQFLAQLSNDWIVIIHEPTMEMRCGWYLGTGLSIPIERTHPDGSIGEHTIRALYWQPLPPPK
jgi:hypothetical protein